MTKHAAAVHSVGRQPAEALQAETVALIFCEPYHRDTGLPGLSSRRQRGRATLSRDADVFRDGFKLMEPNASTLPEECAPTGRGKGHVIRPRFGVGLLVRRRAAAPGRGGLSRTAARGDPSLGGRASARHPDEHRRRPAPQAGPRAHGEAGATAGGLASRPPSGIQVTAPRASWFFALWPDERYGLARPSVALDPDIAAAAFPRVSKPPSAFVAYWSLWRH